MKIADDVLALAECLNTFLPLTPGEERIERPDFVMWLGTETAHPCFSVVQRFRLTDAQVEPAVEQIRALFAARGRKASTWEVGPSSTPANLKERLLALGMKPFEEPISAAMVLQQPPRIDSTIAVRRAETVDDYIAAFQVLNAVFKERVETVEARRERAQRQLAANQAGRGAMFLALLDDEPMAAASSIYMPSAVVLGGAATMTPTRKQGAYRALIAARYEDAVRRGTPALVIQAGQMSRPILEKVGFETVAEVHCLVDGEWPPADATT